MMQKVALIGMRGLVGSVLMQRMQEEGDFQHCEPYFFSSSQAGQVVNIEGFAEQRYQDANLIDMLIQFPIILTCQGGSYTEQIYPKLRAAGWQGYFIDAASTMRMQTDAMMVFDPLNGAALQSGIKSGIKNFIGSNCTVSLLLFALQGLLREDLIEWVSVMTYQAASGAGAEVMRELLLQMQGMTRGLKNLSMSSSSALALERAATELQNSADFPTQASLKPLAGSLLPWIDSDLGEGLSREEAKLPLEAEKMLGKKLPMDGLCVRVGSLRCHSQAVTMQLKRSISAGEVTEILASGNAWVRVVANTKINTLESLTPAAIAGTLNVAIGRIRKLNLPGEIWSAFTVGDQLLWGAAEPLRRFLRMLLVRL